SCGDGIEAAVGNLSAFNNLWDNSNDYVAGVFDSAGGISEDPLFVKPNSGDFSLKEGSPCINTGLDLGYSFYGSAPEMGALETPELAELIITPSYDSLFADETYQFDITALDDLGQPTDQGNLTWDHTFNTALIDADGLLTPQLIDSGKIIVTSDINGITDTSETMSVVPGTLDSMYITPNRDSISAGSTRQFSVEGFDANGNIISNIDDLSWNVVRSIGTIDSMGLFDATTPGFGFIKILHPLLSLTQTDTIFVVPGEISYITVSPAEDAVEQTESSQYLAEGYDADSNLVSDVTATSTWSTTDPSGSVTAEGLYTAGNTNGNYYVKADYNSFSDSGTVEVIGVGALSYIKIEYLNGTELGDTTFTTDNDTTIFYCRGYDAGDALIGDFSAQWSIVDGDSIGTVLGNTTISTILTLTKPGFGKIVAERAGVPLDTSGLITSKTGEIVHFDISPNMATITIDSTLQFTTVSIDADSNVTQPQLVPTWAVLGGIGTIDSSGLFTPSTADTGYITVSGVGVEDTTGIIIVNSGNLNEIVISPNTIDLNIGDSVQFSAIGYDAGSNPTDAGELTWRILGRIGNIDNNGLYIADRPGICSVQVTSSIDAITDMSSALGVDALYITNIPIGNNTVYPGQTRSNLLTFRIENYYDSDKTITGLTIRDASRGVGIQASRLTNYDTINLYYDIDNDSLLTVTDSLIASEVVSSGSTIFSFDPLTIHQGTGRTILTGVNISQFPCDSDSLDLKLFPATDIETGGIESIDGPGELNSLGYSVINGLIADQLQIVSTGVATVIPGDTVYNVFTVDIPRNGYQDDTLKLFSIENSGSATQSDLDSLILYLDNGNNTWGGTGEETYLGYLPFTGDRWAISGIAAPLIQATTRFYIGARLSQYPNNGTTIALSIPINGLNMATQNDGPLYQATIPVDTISVIATEGITFEIMPVLIKQLLPGQNSGPLLGLNMINSYPAPASIDSFLITLYANDADGATQAELDSQIDSVSIYINRDDDYEIVGTADSLLATATISNGTTILATNGLSIPGSGALMELSLVVWLSPINCKNGNSINIGLQNSSDIYFSVPKSTNGDFPLKNDIDFVINAFQLSQVSITTVDNGTFFGGQNDRLALDFTLPQNGYYSDKIQKIKMVNNGSLNLADEIITPKLWLDLTNDGFTADDSLLGEFSASINFWEISDLNFTVADGSARFFVTIDIAGTQFEAGTIQPAIPIQGVEYLSGMTGPDDNAIENSIETLVFPSDRITVISVPIASITAKPESKNNNVLTFALYNGYVDQVQSLSGLKLKNKSHTKADVNYSDYEFGQLSLYFDDNKNRLFDDDSLIAAGFFSDGQLSMSGLDLELPPESLSYFFIVADLPKELIDSDSLTLAVDGHSDLVFSQSVNINGDLP
ncbi:MAG: hypothetical protein GY865_18565, partial [candidate division Zixibacteria bacterium]|nr:hypothetical protein [candidate division Zixibacteria bacterium]